jgi:DNA topoisomerase-2
VIQPATATPSPSADDGTSDRFSDEAAVHPDELRYKQLSHREQILLRPSMYVGTTIADNCTVWLYDERAKRMVQKTINYVPAFLKIFDEILMNAIDHATNQKEKQGKNKNADVQLVKNIRVSIDRATGCIEVTNDGDGIPVIKNENDIYIPELVFGHLLTSSNYDDDPNEGRIVGGQNGIGAKACNIYSKRFEVETVDRNRKRVYNQVFEDNMSRAHEPSVAYSARKNAYTTVKFTPDYDRLGMSAALDDQAYDLLVKRVYDASAVTDNDVVVHLNGNKLECHTFEKFVDLHVVPSSVPSSPNENEDDDKESVASLGKKAVKTERIYEKINDRWEVAAACSDGNGFNQVSFVNGVCTLRGGKHVEHILSQIVRKLTDMIQSKRASAAAAASGVKAQFIKDNLFLFVKSTIPNPSFEGQCKDTLSTPVNKFGGGKIEVSDRFVEKLYKSGIVERVLTLNDASVDKSMKKTDGKKQSSIAGIPKLDDANWAGGNKSRQCTLILTEGDSAKTTAVAGVTQSKTGRDMYGIFPLRGKVMNVCDMQSARIAANQEITNIKKIMGLESGKVYEGVENLRYGKIMIMTDQDVDGSHIKGLLFNLFHQLWPSLLRVDGFLTSMLTPIIKARRRGQVLEFYNGADYDAWKAENSNGKGWEIKYYKGLGTSTTAEAKEYFRSLKVSTYSWTGETSGDALDLAFNKTRAEGRKQWLLAYDKTCGLNYGEPIVPFEDFVNKDLIHFSNYDIVRSIPSVCDGFKISQRKIMYSCFKRNLTKQQIKVAQLAGYVSEHSAYHHGEVSLNATIVDMAQDYVGANNINLLLPIGQFGTRIQGGKDSAASRYIHTLLDPVASLLFKTEDEPILAYLDDDGQPVEPEYFLPILPMVLINGALGIGTGFSTNVPCYNPLDVTRSIRVLLSSETDDLSSETQKVELPDLSPWYKGFTGTIERLDNGKYFSRGRFQRTKPNEIVVTELPIGFWTEDFKELVDNMKHGSPDVKDAKHNHSDTAVSCTIVFSSAAVLDAYLSLEEDPSSTKLQQTKLEKVLKLVSNKNLATNFMYLFNREGRIQKYDTVNDIIREYYAVRLEAYATRKRILLDELQKRARVLENKIRFLQAVIDETIVIHKKNRADLENELSQQGFDRVDDVYDYLLGIPLYTLTIDKKLELDRQLQDVRSKIDRAEQTSERQMWIEELDDFEKKYNSINAKTAKKTSKPFDAIEEEEEEQEEEEVI